MNITILICAGIGIAALWIILRFFSGITVYDNSVLRAKGYTFRSNIYNGEVEKYNGARSVWYDKNGNPFYGKSEE
jgi:hypothetical protein